MPQLDISQWPPQLFWLAISFALLYFVVSRIVIPGIGGVIEERKSTVEGDLAAAGRAKADSEAALKAYEASLAEARGKAQGLGLEVRNKLNAEHDAARHALDVDLAAKAATADASIQAAKTRAMTNIADITQDVVSSIVDQLTGAKVSKADIAAAVSKVSG